MEMGENLKKMLGVSENTPAPSTFANTPTGVQDTERSSWQSPALLRMTGAVAEKIGDAVQDVALKAGVGVTASSVLATGTELVADPANLMGPLGKGAALGAAFTKGQTIWRGVQKGTEDLAYLFPREVGAHFVADKDTAAKFAAHYKESGEVLERTSNVSKPFRTEESEQAATWWPHVTATNLLERGKSPLSAEGRVEIKEVRKAWLKDLENLNTKYKGHNADWEAYADAKDALSIKYNQQIVQRLQKEGYDHISYPLNTEEVAKGAKGVEAGIIFNKGDVQ